MCYTPPWLEIESVVRTQAARLFSSLDLKEEDAWIAILDLTESLGHDTVVWRKSQNRRDVKLLPEQQKDKTAVCRRASPCPLSLQEEPVTRAQRLGEAKPLPFILHQDPVPAA
jgi:hypothetical protein